MSGVDGFGAVSGIGFRQHHSREVISKRGFTDILRADDEPGMMHAAARKRVGELPQRGVMAEQTVDFTWRRESLEAIGLPAAPPLGGPRKSLFGGNIENEGDIRQKISDREPFQSIDQALWYTGRRPLIGSGRIEEAVAYHPLSF